MTIVIPVWDQHTLLLPRCLQAIHNEPEAANVVIVNNASNLPLDVPPEAREITLATRHSIGGARNAALPHINTPFVVFADADDEIAPGSLADSLNELKHHPGAVGVVGRSIVDEHGNYRRGRTPRTPYLLASRYLPSLVPLLWLAAFQCSITSTVLRTESVRDAGGFADADIGEDWRLAARLVRRGRLICLSQPVRVYHRHASAARMTAASHSTSAVRTTVCTDCLGDPAATVTQRLAARLLDS